MSFALIEACKKRKRLPKFFRFNSFGDPGVVPIARSGPFRDNVRVFLQEAGDLEDYTVSGNPLWCILLIHDNSYAMAPLYTIEEHVDHSSHPFCDHCRCVGSFPNFAFLGLVWLLILEMGLLQVWVFCLIFEMGLNNVIAFCCLFLKRFFFYVFCGFIFVLIELICFGYFDTGDDVGCFQFWIFFYSRVLLRRVA